MNRLRILRKSLNMTQLQFASVIGVKQAAYAAIEGGRNTLTERNKKIILDAFSVNPIWFETGKGEIFISQVNAIAQKEIKDTSTISNRLKLIRTSLSLEQSEIASMLTISQDVYLTFETGTRTPPGHILRDICNTFLVNPEWLKTGEGEIFREQTKENNIITEAISKDTGTPKEWSKYGIGNIFTEGETYQETDVIDRLKLLRKTLKITQTQIADAIGVSRSGYASIEMKLTRLTPRNLNAICDTYSVNPIWLETGEGEMFLKNTTGTNTPTSSLQKTTNYSSNWIETGMGSMLGESQQIYQKADVTDRFLIALEHLKIQGVSYSDVANKIGASTSLVSEIRRGKTKLTPHNAQRFIEAFNINTEWLIHGKGKEIFVTVSTENATNAHPVEMGNSEWIDVQFVPLHARASFAETFLDTNVREIETIRIPKRPGINYRNAKIFEVDGDSMEPTLVSGEQVLCEIIDPNNWKFTTGVVVVAFGNMVVIKRIKDNDLINGKLVLWSDNELGGKITLSEDTDPIRRIYKVKYTIYKPIR